MIYEITEEAQKWLTQPKLTINSIHYILIHAYAILMFLFSVRKLYIQRRDDTKKALFKELDKNIESKIDKFKIDILKLCLNKKK